MIGLVFVIISMSLFSFFIEFNNYQNINYTSFRSFDNKKIVDSLMKEERIFELVKTNEFQKVRNDKYDNADRFCCEVRPGVQNQ